MAVNYTELLSTTGRMYKPRISDSKSNSILFYLVFFEKPKKN